MINTKLLNYLVNKDMEQKSVSANINLVLLKRKLLIERLKNYSLIVLFVFFILLLLIVLYKLFPNEAKSLTNPFKDSFANEQVIPKKSSENQSYANDKNKGSSSNMETVTEPKNDDLKEKALKNGFDYVKEHNYIYKREWVEGILIKKTKLAPTIKESKKLEDIPQFSPEKKE